jgi:hypothetical protein
MFVGKIKTEWLSDGDTMVLLEDCSFIDSTGYRWECLAGDRVDGASIPKFFWRIIGSPLRGNTGRPQSFMMLHVLKE